MRKLAAVACVMVLTAFPAHAQYVDLGYLSLRLNEDMTEYEVLRALGYRPDSIELSTCGQLSDRGSWQCRIWKYWSDYPLSLLSVEFYKDRTGAWRVNSWNVSR
jgi:hypothetical protein